MATNTRYRHFQQEIFTAGDYEQFVSIIQEKRRKMKKCEKYDDYTHIFSKLSWEKYKCGEDLFSTFEYMFHKFKKGIYVQIVDNELTVFLPFSNVDYQNEYTLDIDKSKYSSFEELYKKICQYEGRPYITNKVCRYPELWYCNNGLVRYEYPIQENDSGIGMIHDMFQTLCRERKVADCEFYINKRDFPILSNHEPYTALVEKGTPLYSYDSCHYLPILSMCSTEDNTDIAIPTWEDWARVAYHRHKKTFPKHFREYNDSFELDFKKKKSTVVFRGASTGLGVTIKTNPRFFFTDLSKRRKSPYLDIGIVKWNCRPRKNHPSTYLDIPEPDVMGLGLSESITPMEQSKYKYILHLPGHSCAYRLSLELSMGSVIFYYPSEYQLWYFHLLKPYEHYIPLSRGMDEEEIFEKIEWCENNIEECERIAKNARMFYEEYLLYDGILDCLSSLTFQMNEKFRYWEWDYTCVEQPYMIDIKKICPEIKEEEIIKDTKQTMISKGMMNGNLCIFKKSKNLEYSHMISIILESAIGTLTPNFLYSRHLTMDGRLVFEELTSSLSLDNYLMGRAFKMEVFKGIVLQIILSIEIAQQRVGFIHYDLTPWNVMLNRNEGKKLCFKFLDRTVNVNGCKYVVKIIDFEYASVLVEDERIHNIKPFFLSKSHDVVIFLYNCSHLLLKYQRLQKHEMKWIYEMICYLSGKSFVNIQELKLFLSREKKFSKCLLTSEKNCRSNDFSFKTLHNYIGYMNQSVSNDVVNDWGNCYTTRENTIIQLYTFEKKFQEIQSSFEIPSPQEQEEWNTRRQKNRNRLLSISPPSYSYTQPSLQRWNKFGYKCPMYPIYCDLLKMIYLHHIYHIPSNINLKMLEIE